MEDILLNVYIRLHPRLAHQMERLPTDEEMAIFIGCSQQEICKIKQKLEVMSLREIEDIYFSKEAIL